MLQLTLFSWAYLVTEKGSKTVVKHRACGTCKWWSRHRPNLPVCPHRCEKSSRKCPYVESTSGDQGVKELNESGTPVKYLEGDGDNTLIARLRSDLNMKKRFDRNHIVKTLVKACLRCKKKNLVSQ